MVAQDKGAWECEGEVAQDSRTWGVRGGGPRQGDRRNLDLGLKPSSGPELTVREEHLEPRPLGPHRTLGRGMVFLSPK